MSDRMLMFYLCLVYRDNKPVVMTTLIKPVSLCLQETISQWVCRLFAGDQPIEFYWIKEEKVTMFFSIELLSSASVD